MNALRLLRPGPALVLALLAVGLSGAAPAALAAAVAAEPSSATVVQSGPQVPATAAAASAGAATAAAASPAAVAPPPAAGAARPSRPAAQPAHYEPERFSGRAGRYYRLVWGIDQLRVKVVESGEVVRFSWRVLDPERAKVLSDKRAEPSLVDAQAGAQLLVPAVEQIGQLRQAVPPEAGKSYWMAFSNKGRLVKRGDRVDVIVGPFRADGLAVD